MTKKLIALSGIGKSFGPTRVLNDVSFDLEPGEVHLLAGENGAGKSTLIKILAGIYTDYEGSIILDGKAVRFRNPQDANRQGISVIHQEMSLVDSMSVVDNIFLGREATHYGSAWLDRDAQLARAFEICQQLELALARVDLALPVEQFSLSMKNQIEIVKALSFDAQVIVMDEPTSALNRSEVECLFRVIDGLKARGCGIIYISHKMEEIYRLADRLTVLRDGRWVGTAMKSECPQAKLVHWMIGRELSEQFPTRRPVDRSSNVPILQLKKFQVPDPAPGNPAAVKAASFAVGRGEIVGIAGLQGSGNSELLNGLFGAYGEICTGDILIDGKSYIPRNPRDAIAHGLALVTGDRKTTGLVLAMSVDHNITLAGLPRLSPGGWLQAMRERVEVAEQTKALQLRFTSGDQAVATLSGGNQQKVALAKWLVTQPRILLLEDPTRGVDIGAKHEIYELMQRWTDAGMAILMISTELPELLGLCDRIVVMHRGVVAETFDRTNASPENILQAAMGVTESVQQTSGENERATFSDQRTHWNSCDSARKSAVSRSSGFFTQWQDSPFRLLAEPQVSR